ncbi:MAG: helix-turn-helix domain-containing protein, partial [Phaeodactylibacter sp.]|nr:helix-turn-helix domain-containing protein [Phaeodactylibacter sp.]
EKLKANDDTRHIPVIMLTARAESSDRLKALRIGVDDYLNKPFDEEELLVRIENLLKNQENRRQEAPAGAEGKNFAPTLSGEDRKWLETFEDYVGENLSNDTLTVSFLAQEFAMSESTLLRQLKRLTGLTTNQYLQEIRLNKARQLLENATYTTISQVAAEVGYGDARSFSRTFRKRFGKLPSDLLEIT